MVEARQGIGSFVLAPEQRAAIRIDRETLKEGQNMERLFELRCILEVESAALASERRNQEHLDAIKAALDRMSGEERWEDGSVDADLLFHREIARATGNSYIHTFISFVCEQIRRAIYYARLTNPLHDIVEVNVGEHVRIYEALVAGDPAAAEAAMRAHIIGAANRSASSCRHRVLSAQTEGNSHVDRDRLPDFGRLPACRGYRTDSGILC
jgi:DNA-binding FadR family transcriptional regulator